MRLIVEVLNGWILITPDDVEVTEDRYEYQQWIKGGKVYEVKRKHFLGAFEGVRECIRTWIGGGK